MASDLITHTTDATFDADVLKSDIDMPLRSLKSMVGSMEMVITADQAIRRQGRAEMESGIHCGAPLLIVRAIRGAEAFC